MTWRHKPEDDGRWEGFRGFHRLSYWSYCYLPGGMSGFRRVADLVFDARFKVRVGPL